MMNVNSPSHSTTTSCVHGAPESHSDTRSVAGRISFRFGAKKNKVAEFLPLGRACRLSHRSRQLSELCRSLSEDNCRSLSESVGVVGGQLSELCRAVGTELRPKRAACGPSAHGRRGAAAGACALCGRLAVPSSTPHQSMTLSGFRRGPCGPFCGTSENRADSRVDCAKA